MEEHGVPDVGLLQRRLPVFDPATAARSEPLVFETSDVLTLQQGLLGPAS